MSKEESAFHKPDLTICGEEDLEMEYNNHSRFSFLHLCVILHPNHFGFFCSAWEDVSPGKQEVFFSGEDDGRGRRWSLDQRRWECEERVSPRGTQRKSRESLER